MREGRGTKGLVEGHTAWLRKHMEVCKIGVASEVIMQKEGRSHSHKLLPAARYAAVMHLNVVPSTHTHLHACKCERAQAHTHVKLHINELGN